MVVFKFFTLITITDYRGIYKERVEQGEREEIHFHGDRVYTTNSKRVKNLLYKDNVDQ